MNSTISKTSDIQSGATKKGAASDDARALFSSRF
jgi:hypothetical protein